MKKSSLSKAVTFVFAAGISAYAVAGDAPNFLRWSNAVGEVIKPTNIATPTPDGSKYYTVRFTYEALKSCKEMSVYGRNYAKDGVEIGTFALGLGGKLNVPAGQKFRDDVLMAYEPGHYLVLDKVYCRQ